MAMVSCPPHCGMTKAVSPTVAFSYVGEFELVTASSDDASVSDDVAEELLVNRPTSLGDGTKHPLPGLLKFGKHHGARGIDACRLQRLQHG